MAQDKYIKLQKLEQRINKRCTHTEHWLDTKLGSALYRRWVTLVTELRGWGTDMIAELGEDGLTKQSWLDYCTANNLQWNYTFGDVTA